MSASALQILFFLLKYMSQLRPNSYRGQVPSASGIFVNWLLCKCKILRFTGSDFSFTILLSFRIRVSISTESYSTICILFDEAERRRRFLLLLNSGKFVNKLKSSLNY